MKKIIVFLALPIFLLNLSAAALMLPAQAADPLDMQNQQGFESGGPMQSVFGQADNPADPRIIVANVIKIILGFLGIIFVSLLIFGGFKYMTAGGNEDQVSDAKKSIIRAIIGLAIILSAYAITIFVSKSLIKAVSNTGSIFPF
jgi:hypothetical protein